VIINTPIFTPRLMLRTLTRADVGQRYLGWMSDADVVRFLEVRFAPEQTVETLTDFVEAANASSSELLLGIFLHGTSNHIGNIKLGPLSTKHNRADLGFLIGSRDEWGKGYATEAIAAMAKYALGGLKLAKVTAGCYAGNRGSAHALEKAGFSLEARLRGHWLSGGHRDDGLLFAIHPGAGQP
jgi:RimJ/RimL family protein N-acetyltransferase